MPVRNVFGGTCVRGALFAFGTAFFSGCGAPADQDGPTRSPENVNSAPLEVDVFRASRDATLTEARPNQNRGTDDRLEVRAGHHDEERSVVAFDLSTVPLEVTRATLVLTLEDSHALDHCDDHHASGPHHRRHRRGHDDDCRAELIAKPLATDFTEGEGHGAPGVTWNCPTDANTRNPFRDCRPGWNGGLPAAAEVTGEFLDGAHATVSFDVTEAVRDGASAGFVVLAQSDRQTFRFYSREGAERAHNSDLAPRLVLENLGHSVGPAGGTIRAHGGAVVLEVPPGALASTQEIKVAPAPIEADLPQSGLLAGTLHDFQPSGLHFAIPATLSIAFDPDAVPPAADPAHLVILSSIHGDGEPLTDETPWEERPSSADLGRMVVTGTIEHFSHEGVGEPVVRMEIALPNNEVPPFLLVTGQTRQFTALPLSAAAQVLRHAVEYTSANGAIATAADAAAGGLQLCNVTGVSAGTTSVTATARNSAPDLNASKSVDVSVSGGSQIMQRKLAVAMFHACVIRADGVPECWGQNTNGELGNGSNVDSSTRVPVVGLTSVVSLSTSFGSTCALLSNGTVSCWGLLVGNGTTTPSNVPVAVPGLTNIIDIAVGNDHSCAVKSDGTAYCWGSNLFGRLGDGSTTTRLSPTQVLGMTGAFRIAAGDHTCAVLAGGTASCWGWNNHGQLGDGTTIDSLTPVPVRNSNGSIYSGVADIAVSEETHHTCALLANGSASCWGENLQGTLGDGTNTDQHFPANVLGVTTARDLTTFNRNGCVLLANGTVQCWGYSAVLGNGATTDQLMPGAPVTGLTDAVAVSGEETVACALRATGDVFCWGLQF